MNGSEPVTSASYSAKTWRFLAGSVGSGMNEGAKRRFGSVSGSYQAPPGHLGAPARQRRKTILHDNRQRGNDIPL